MSDVIIQEKMSAPMNYFICWTRFVVEFKKKFQSQGDKCKEKHPVVSLWLYSSKIKISAKLSNEYLTFFKFGKKLW